MTLKLFPELPQIFPQIPDVIGQIRNRLTLRRIRGLPE